MERLDNASPCSGGIEKEDEVPLVQRFARKAERRDVSGFDVYAKLLTQFPDERNFRRFSLLHLAAREFPQTRHEPTAWPLLNKDLSRIIDQGGRNDL